MALNKEQLKQGIIQLQGYAYQNRCLNGRVCRTLSKPYSRLC